MMRAIRRMRIITTRTDMITIISGDFEEDVGGDGDWRAIIVSGSGGGKDDYWGGVVVLAVLSFS